MTNFTHAIVGPDKWYMRGARTFVQNGVALYSDGKTVEQYLAEHPDCRAIPYDEWKADYDAYLEKQKVGPTEIPEEKWWYALEVLPPCRWHSHGGIEFFHVSELLEMKLADWYARRGDMHWHFVDDCDAPSDQLLLRMDSVIY